MRAARKLALLMALAALAPLAAHAANSISAPDVTRGQAEIGFRGGWDFDNDSAPINGQQIRKWVANYGVTDRWRAEVKGVETGDEDEIDWTGIEVLSRYQFLKDKEGWVRLAGQANYRFSLKSGKADRLELTVLAARNIGPLANIININFENEIGNYARGGTDLNAGYKMKYRYDEHFEPGAEFYGDWGKFGTPNSVTPNKFLGGPVISGKVMGGVKYEIGFLFGLNDEAPDKRFNLSLSYVFRP